MNIPSRPSIDSEGSTPPSQHRQLQYHHHHHQRLPPQPQPPAHFITSRGSPTARVSLSPLPGSPPPSASSSLRCNSCHVPGCIHIRQGVTAGSASPDRGGYGGSYGRGVVVASQQPHSPSSSSMTPMSTAGVPPMSHFQAGGVARSGNGVGGMDQQPPRRITSQAVEDDARGHAHAAAVPYGRSVSLPTSPAQNVWQTDI